MVVVVVVHYSRHILLADWPGCKIVHDHLTCTAESVNRVGPDQAPLFVLPVNSLKKSCFCEETTEFCLFFTLSLAPVILLSYHSQTIDTVTTAVVGVTMMDTHESRVLPTSKTIQISC